MSRSKTETTKKNYITTAASAFAGVLMAVPMVLAISSPGNNAGALQGQNPVSTAQVTDFAKFAYAYSQGYEAKAVSTTAATTCTDAKASADVAGVSASASTSVGPQVEGASTWKPAGGSGSGGSSTAPKQVADMVKAYNSYYSSIYNSSTSMVMNTNSNNTVGSNNTTSTDINVKDSKGVLIGVSNNPEATNISNSESFNKDSYNPETSVINDSFNKEETITKIENSGNTTTENSAETKVEDSYNTSTETKTETETTNTNNTTNETKIDDSFNTEVKVEDVKVES